MGDLEFENPEILRLEEFYFEIGGIFNWENYR